MQRELLQNAIDGVSRWCVVNKMSLSVPKCAVLCSRGQSHTYWLNGQVLPVVRNIRDLGVVITPDLNFDLHITQIVQSASTLCNMIFRCFIVKPPEFCINLYKSIVIPKLSYCCEVWRPHLKKHVEAIERVNNRFRKRVARRCNVSEGSLDLRPIQEIHDAADARMYIKLCKLNNIDNFCNIRANNLRSSQTVTALAVARTERINNMFAWRVARKLNRSRHLHSNNQ